MFNKTSRKTQTASEQRHEKEKRGGPLYPLMPWTGINGRIKHQNVKTDQGTPHYQGNHKRKPTIQSLFWRRAKGRKGGATLIRRRPSGIRGVRPEGKKIG